MKKFYAEPEFEVTTFVSEDIITLSGLDTEIDDESMDEYTGTGLW